MALSYDMMEREDLDRISLRRTTGPEGIAGRALFLLSRFGHNVSGQSLGVGGNLESL